MVDSAGDDDADDAGSVAGEDTVAESSTDASVTPDGDGPTSDGARATGEADAETSDDAEAPAEWAAASDGDGRREVEVPLALYKRVTVFGTLIAVVAVLLGFVLLDAATLRQSSLRSLVVGALEVVGVTPPDPILSGVFALAGLGSIALGAGVYVLSTRFRTEGMGKSKDDADENSSDG